MTTGQQTQPVKQQCVCHVSPHCCPLHPTTSLGEALAGADDTEHRPDPQNATEGAILGKARAQGGEATPQKTLGQVAYDGFHAGPAHGTWGDSDNATWRPYWEAAAEAVRWAVLAELSDRSCELGVTHKDMRTEQALRNCAIQGKHSWRDVGHADWCAHCGSWRTHDQDTPAHIYKQPQEGQVLREAQSPPAGPEPGALLNEIAARGCTHDWREARSASTAEHLVLYRVRCGAVTVQTLYCSRCSSHEDARVADDAARAAAAGRDG